MQIFLAWIEKRSYVRDYGKPQVCNWTSNGTEQDFDDAREYARANGFNVYAFPKEWEWHEAREHARHMMSLKS